MSTTLSNAQGVYFVQSTLSGLKPTQCNDFNGSVFRHRLGACNWANYNFYAIVRDVFNSNHVYQGSYLDLEGNPVNFDSATGKIAESAGNSWGLTPVGSPYPGNYLTTMQSFDIGAAYVFVLITDKTYNVKRFAWYSPELDSNGQYLNPNCQLIDVPWPATGPQTVWDISSATVNGQIVLFFSQPYVGKIWTMTFNGSSFSPLTLLQDIGGETLSIDSTAVMMPAGSGGVTCYLTALWANSGVQSIRLFEVNMVGGIAASLSEKDISFTMPKNLDLGSYQNSVRCCWGPPPTQSGTSMPKNALTILANLHQSAHGYGSTMLYIAAIDLTQSPLAVFADLQQTSLDLPYGESGEYVATHNACFPMALSSGTGQAQYFMNYVGTLRQYVNTDTYIILSRLQFSSMKFVQNGDVQVGQSELQGSVNDPSAQTAASAWILLGVITGLPPFPEGTGVDQIQLTFTSSGNQSSSIETTDGVNVTAGASGGGFSVEGTYKHAVTNSTEISSAWQYSATFMLTNKAGSVIKPDVGWLIVLKPIYNRVDYIAQTWDGQATDITLTVLWTSASGTIDGDEVLASVDFYEFNINEPTSVPKSPYTYGPPSLYTFPAGTVWPKSEDVCSWQDFASKFYGPNLTKWGLTPFKGAFNSVKGTTGAANSTSLLVSQTTTETNSISNSIDIQTGAKFSVFNFKAGFNYSTKTQVKTAYNQSLSITISYGQLTEANQVTVQPLIYRGVPTPGNPLPWTPAIYQMQAPWLLTWSVSEYTPALAARAD